MDQRKVYEVYFFANYTIRLNEENKIDELKVGNGVSQVRFSSIDNLNRDALKIALKYLFISNDEEFLELYVILKQNDPEMFEYAKEVVEDIRSSCLGLSLIDGI